jgi:hypothetical protein
MCGAIPPLPYMSTRCDAYSEQEQIYFHTIVNKGAGVAQSV